MVSHFNATILWRFDVAQQHALANHCHQRLGPRRRQVSINA
jgi:hypothetical protein